MHRYKGSPGIPSVKTSHKLSAESAEASHRTSPQWRQQKISSTSETDDLAAYVSALSRILLRFDPPGRGGDWATSSEERASLAIALELMEKIVRICRGDPERSNEWTLSDWRFGAELHRRHPALSPTEIRVCSYVRSNLKMTYIAELLDVQPATIKKHRGNIRRKIGLKHKENLTLYLASVSVTSGE